VAATTAHKQIQTCRLSRGLLTQIPKELDSEATSADPVFPLVKQPATSLPNLFSTWIFRRTRGFLCLLLGAAIFGALVWVFVPVIRLITPSADL